MLRGLALAILLLNLALFFWGSSRVEPSGPAASPDAPSSLDHLPELVLLEEIAEEPVAPASSDPCVEIGPVDPEEADALQSTLASLALQWQRRDSAEGSLLVVEPGSASGWPESDIRALVGALDTEISACRTLDPIAPEPPRP